MFNFPLYLSPAYKNQPYVWPHIICAVYTPCIHVNDNLQETSKKCRGDSTPDKAFNPMAHFAQFAPVHLGKWKAWEQ